MVSPATHFRFVALVLIHGTREEPLVEAVHALDAAAPIVAVAESVVILQRNMSAVARNVVLGLAGKLSAAHCATRPVKRIEEQVVDPMVT